ncbi:hypothetical protein ACFLWO_01695 [Chloroflexota bacterium]
MAQSIVTYIKVPGTWESAWLSVESPGAMPLRRNPGNRDDPLSVRKAVTALEREVKLPCSTR